MSCQRTQRIRCPYIFFLVCRISTCQKVSWMLPREIFADPYVNLFSILQSSSVKLAGSAVHCMAILDAVKNDEA